MQISFTEKKNIRKSFGKLKESLSIPNLIEVQKNSYKELTDFDLNAGDLTKGFDRVFKSIFPIEDLNDKATLEYVSYRLEKPKFDVEECITRGLTYLSYWDLFSVDLGFCELDKASCGHGSNFQLTQFFEIGRFFSKKAELLKFIDLFLS